MSLRARLTLAIVLLVGATALLAWGIAGRAVVRPFAGAVLKAWVDEAVFIADRVEAGEDPQVLGEGLRVEVREVSRLPAQARRWRPVPHPEREVRFKRGPENRLAVRTADGWLVLHRDLDLERPGRRLRGFLLLGAAGIVLLASAIATLGLRPVETAREALARLAAGELHHRIEERGPGELREMARTFNRMADEIARRIRSERELMAGISHELRTPLTRLRLELELLRDGGAPPARIEAMEGDVAEMEALIAELVEISRMELGEVAVQRERVDLGALVRELDPEVRVRGEGTAEADPRLLRRALGNLLSNARRYAAGSPVTVTVADGRVEVEDEGPGVPEDALPHLFEPFWRGEGSRARTTGGLGLGLMIVRQVAQLHGGSVHAENRAAGGLRVVLDLSGGSRGGGGPAGGWTS